METMFPETSRKTVIVALFLCGIFLCVWIVFIGPKNPPIDRKVSSVALSSTARWLAAGTSQGKIAVWDQTSGDAPQQIAFPHGSLNDLQFSPDEHLLAIASGDLGMYAPAEPAALRLLRSDQRNYGSVRFSRDGQNLLVITGAGVIETIDAHSGTLRLKVCCSSIYGEAAFTPNGQAIANAGHWPSLWDARSGQLVGRLTTNREFATFRPIAFDASRDAILMGSQDGRVYAWDLKKRQLVAVSPPQPAYVDTLAVSTNGWVIFAGFGKNVELWNPDTGQRRFLPAARPTSNMVLGPDGTSIIFGTADGTIESWDIRTEQRIREMKIPGT
jgi:WD40 repeat protein